MRVRLFVEIEINDSAVLELQRKIDAAVPEQRPLGTIDFVMADSMGRQVKKVVGSFYGVRGVDCVHIPTFQL